MTNRRNVPDVDAALLIACSRRAMAIQRRDEALETIRLADAEIVTCERHIALCDRSIGALLDERIEVRAKQAEKVVAE